MIDTSKETNISTATFPLEQRTKNQPNSLTGTYQLLSMYL